MSEADSSVWRIALVEDHVLQRQRTREVLSRESGLVVVASCSSLQEYLVWWAGWHRSSDRTCSSST